MRAPEPFDADLFLQLGKQVLAEQPFSVLLGTELVSLTPGHCVLQLPLGETLKQQHGFAHGGVVSYLADNALTFAGGTAMRVPVVTAEFKINYLRPAQGQRLLARASALHVGKNQSVCRCDVFAIQDAEESLVAIAQGTISKVGDAPPAPLRRARQDGEPGS